MTTKHQPNPALVNLRKHLAQGGRAYCHAEAGNRDRYSDSMEFSFSVEHKDKTITSGIKIPGVCRNGHTDQIETYVYEGETRTKYADGGLYRPRQGFLSFSYSETLKSALADLPDDAALTIEVYLDAGTNEICVESRLHNDKVYLHAKWERATVGKPKTHTRTYMLDSSTCRHNSARFGGAK